MDTNKKNIIIPSKEYTILSSLKNDALKAEKILADRLRQFYLGNKEMSTKFSKASGYGDYVGENDNSKIIKVFYWAAVNGKPPKIYSDYVASILKDEVNDFTEKNSKEIAEFFLDNSGFVDVMDSLGSNLKKALELSLKAVALISVTGKDSQNFMGQSKQYESYTKGNNIEGEVFSTIAKNIVKGSLGSGVTVEDTSPHLFKNSVLYDIMINIGDFGLPIEVKSGIQKNYKRSSFEFGTFSSTSLGGGIDKYGKHLLDNTYQELLSTVGERAQEVVQQMIEGQKADDAMTTFMIDTSLDYVDWRMRNGNYPIFGNAVHSNTASEIIQGLMNGLGSIDTSTYTISNEDVYTTYVNDLKKGEVNFTDIVIRSAQKEALDKAFRAKSITPKFRAQLWYGRR